METQMRMANPQWEGAFFAGYYANQTPVFEFTDGPEINAVLLNGGNIKNFKPLKDIRLRILCLRDSDVTSLDFLPRLNWEKEVILELQNCKNITDFNGLKLLPLTVININNTPFADTGLLGDKINSMYLDQTQVRKLNLAKPELLENLVWIQDKQKPDVDITQIAAMKRLGYLQLKHIKGFDGNLLSSLQYLENLVLSDIDHIRLTELSPHVMSTVWLENCPDLEIGNAFNNKIIDKLFLVRCGDPARIFSKLTNTKINQLVIDGVHVPDLSFLKRIKELQCVRFRKCTGLPEKIDLPYVQVIVE